MSYPTRIEVYCDAHTDRPRFVTAYNRATSDWDVTGEYGEPLGGDWVAEPLGEGWGEGQNGAAVNSRGNTDLECNQHAARNRKPVSISAGRVNETFEALAYAGIADPTLAEIRILRQAIAVADRALGSSGLGDRELRNVGDALREMRDKARQPLPTE